LKIQETPHELVVGDKVNMPSLGGVVEVLSRGMNYLDVNLPDNKGSIRLYHDGYDPLGASFTQSLKIRAGLETFREPIYKIGIGETTFTGSADHLRV